MSTGKINQQTFSWMEANSAANKASSSDLKANEEPENLSILEYKNRLIKLSETALGKDFCPQYQKLAEEFINFFLSETFNTNSDHAHQILNSLQENYNANSFYSYYDIKKAPYKEFEVSDDEAQEILDTFDMLFLENFLKVTNEQAINLYRNTQEILRAAKQEISSQESRVNENTAAQNTWKAK